MVTADDIRRRIGEEQVHFSFTRSGGPGGQNVNKVNTRVTLWFELWRCRALTSDEKLTISQRLNARINRDGCLQLTVSRFRTQGANRAAALEKLYEFLAAALERRRPRRPTAAPARATRRRLESKRARSIRKRERRGRGDHGDEPG